MLKSGNVWLDSILLMNGLMACVSGIGAMKSGATVDWGKYGEVSGEQLLLL
jgi:uncharacterized membrane-anchored protein